MSDLPITRCRTCFAPISWVETSTGKRMPVEADGETGNVVIGRSLLNEPVAFVVEPGEGTHVSHFATCPQAKEWRR